MGKKYTELVQETLDHISEAFPWDLQEMLEAGEDALLVDIREPGEYEAMHIDGSINVPRGILESACDWGYQETVPELAGARQRKVVLMCKSGNRSALAADTLQKMGYEDVVSLKTGIRGWNDYEQPLVDAGGNTVDIEKADEFFTDDISPEQMGPSQNN